MSDKLLPCPFCGGDAHSMAQHWDDGSHVWWVECKVCGAEGKRCDGGMEAIDVWNTRAQTVFGLTLDEVRQMMKRDAERAERTCEFKPFKDEDWSEPNATRGVCSECSALMYGKDGFCPNCGARVVSE